MITEYTIRHRTRGDVGGFASQTEATVIALRIGWPLEDWEIEPVEGNVADVAPFADLRPSPTRDRALDRWARS